MELCKKKKKKFLSICSLCMNVMTNWESNDINTWLCEPGKQVTFWSLGGSVPKFQAYVVTIKHLQRATVA